MLRFLIAIAVPLLLAGCFSETPEGLAPAESRPTTVKMDFLHKPLPEIPLPNDIATRYDATSATKRRINVSMIAPTSVETRVRTLIGELDGWGVTQPITIPFTGPLDIQTILDAHRDPIYALDDDLIYLIDVDRDSPEFGQAKRLDFGEGNYPAVLERREYWENDPRNWTLSIFFDEADEDLNGNGVLDPGEDLNGNGLLDEGEDTNGNGLLDPPEDTDADGVLDKPNYLPGHHPARDDLAGRADALMTFYERETDTLILRPMVPLRERTTYAVVITKRLLDADGVPVGSPFPSINHVNQNEALAPLAEVLPAGLAMGDVAFAFSFTTQSLQSHWIAVRDGLYGHGVQGHIGADYPAELDEVLPLLDDERAANPFIMTAEQWAAPFAMIASNLLGVDATSEEWRYQQESMQFVDYYVIGTFDSPQLYNRRDADGALLPLDAQSWPADLDREPVTPERETVYFTLAMPREEVIDRTNGAQPPVVILGHGYTGNRFGTMQDAGYFARHGLATLAIDCPSHGLDLGESDEAAARDLLNLFKLGAFGEAALADRSFDQNNDGKPDSGADFWTSYMFHTRDVVRQCGLDYMQLIRVLRSFDGERKWAFDLDGDGQPELAGDFNADGVVDVGHNSIVTMTGGSLGGIMAMLVGAIEPEVTATAPIAGGGGLADIGNRSQQGGVREAVILRVMGPLYVGNLDAEGAMALRTIIPDLNDTGRETLGTVEGVKAGDTVLVKNLRNGLRGCGYVSAEGTFRVSVDSDQGDATVLEFYAGPKLVTGSTECELMPGATPSLTVDTFGAEIEFQGITYAEGSPLVALAEGMGERRATPGMRRFLGIAQLVLDAGDPLTYARHMIEEPLYYPGTDQTSGAHGLIITTVGDMNVPGSSGVNVARAAGLLKYLEPDARYGKPTNQVILDTYIAESVDNIGRYHFLDEAGEPTDRTVHIDVENYSRGQDLWGATVPRLDPPLNLGMDAEDALGGGYSAAVFPMGDPQGQHGFDPAGRMTDQFMAACRAGCVEGEPCECGPEVATYDHGRFMYNMIGEYLTTGGAFLNIDECHSDGTCAYERAVPEIR